MVWLQSDAPFYFLENVAHFPRQIDFFICNIVNVLALNYPTVNQFIHFNT